MMDGRCELLLRLEHDIDHIYFIPHALEIAATKSASLLDAMVLPIMGYLVPSILANPVSNIFRYAHTGSAPSTHRSYL